MDKQLGAAHGFRVYVCQYLQGGAVTQCVGDEYQTGTDRTWH